MSEIQKGYPQLSQTYWEDLKVKNDGQNLTDINANFSLKKLNEISIFKNRKDI